MIEDSCQWRVIRLWKMQCWSLESCNFRKWYKPKHVALYCKTNESCVSSMKNHINNKTRKKWDSRSSGMLRSIDWSIVDDIWGAPCRSHLQGSSQDNTSCNNNACLQIVLLNIWINLNPPPPRQVSPQIRRVRVTYSYSENPTLHVIRSSYHCIQSLWH